MHFRKWITSEKYKMYSFFLYFTSNDLFPWKYYNIFHEIRWFRNTKGYRKYVLWLNKWKVLNYRFLRMNFTFRCSHKQFVLPFLKLWKTVISLNINPNTVKLGYNDTAVLVCYKRVFAINGFNISHIKKHLKDS